MELTVENIDRVEALKICCNITSHVKKSQPGKIPNFFAEMFFYTPETHMSLLCV